jgi:hypothetical protein
MTGNISIAIGRSNQSKGNPDTQNYDAGSGAFKRMWGAYGNTPVDQFRCVGPIPGEPFPTEGRGPEQFTIAHAVRVSNDGLVTWPTRPRVVSRCSRSREGIGRKCPPRRDGNAARSGLLNRSCLEVPLRGIEPRGRHSGSADADHCRIVRTNGEGGERVLERSRDA